MNQEQRKETSHDGVVFYRKAWVWIILMLVFSPLGILIGLTGDVFFSKNGQFVKFPKASRLIVSIGFGSIILIKIFGPMLIHR